MKKVWKVIGEKKREEGGEGASREEARFNYTKREEILAQFNSRKKQAEKGSLEVLYICVFKG